MVHKAVAKRTNQPYNSRPISPLIVAIVFVFVSPFICLFTSMSFPGRAMQRAWHLVDASNQTVGRLATQVAPILRGKHKPTFSPNQDMGDTVVIINAEKVSERIHGFGMYHGCGTIPLYHNAHLSQHLLSNYFTFVHFVFQIF
jgi:hypothetical protein